MSLNELKHLHNLAVAAEKEAYNNYVNFLCAELERYGIDYDYLLVSYDGDYRRRMESLVDEQYDLEADRVICDAPDCTNEVHHHGELCPACQADHEEHMREEAEETRWIERQQFPTR